MAASLRKVCCQVTANIHSRSLLFRSGPRQRQQQPWRSLSDGRRRLSPSSLGLQARMRPLPILLATGGGYLGYDQYGRYQDRRLVELGIEVPPHVANEAQVGRLHTLYTPYGTSNTPFCYQR